MVSCFGNKLVVVTMVVLVVVQFLPIDGAKEERIGIESLPLEQQRNSSE